MALLDALKKRFAKRMANNKLVQDEVLEDIAHQPAALEALGARPIVFGHVLSGALQNDKALRRILQNPSVLKRIMKTPEGFATFLEAVSANPEAVYRVLSRPGVRSALASQNIFLNWIVNNRRVLLNLLKKVPTEMQADALRAVVEADAARLRELTDTPEIMIAALMYRSRAGQDAVRNLEINDKYILDGLEACLRDHMPDLLLAMVEANPDLLQAGGALHDQAVRAISTDPDSIAALCTLFAVTPGTGETPADRVGVLLTRLFQEPAILQAMLRDDGLRRQMLHIVQDCIEATGDTVPDLLDAPRSAPREATS